MWIKTTDCEPLEDGEYMVQTRYGRVTSMLYTFKGGWNTYYTLDGELKTMNKKESDYIVRWFDLPKPPELKGGE